MQANVVCFYHEFSPSTSCQLFITVPLSVSVHQPICKELTSGVLGDYIDLVYFSVIMLLSNVSTSVL